MEGEVLAPGLSCLLSSASVRLLREFGLRYGIVSLIIQAFVIGIYILSCNISEELILLCHFVITSPLNPEMVIPVKCFVEGGVQEVGLPALPDR